ncbi:MAG: preprotein translocase subunit SecA [Fimbriimonadaceae bacterium]|nr:preprotein translocase subunit SecA [Fimbriimonadaceae bacterium]QYK57612.1 MAG: preprotein translocase subunit SecA [Fimbriimonadaceae bacterium]
MIKYLRKLFDTSEKDVKAVLPLIDQINELEPATQDLTDDQLKAKSAEFKSRLAQGEKLEQILPEVFAVVREASRRTLNMRQFDVQLVGGIVLHQGRIAEMKTGEGKTLVAVAPMVLNALTGKGAHLVTVNDYLARRDAVWMGPIYHFLGLSLGIIQGQGADSDELGGSYIYDPGYEHEDPRYLHCRPCTRREAYLCDITYGTNHEFGFDYLRDNMAFQLEQLSMRELNFAIVDEVDSILIDEARTPHIISGPSTQDTAVYKMVDAVVKTMDPELHWSVEKKNHSASLTEEGMDYVEEHLGIDNMASDPRLMHHVNASVKAYAIFEKNVEYVVRGNEVVLVDENTGRLMFGRRLSDGLHQAIEAKEGVPIQRESQTVAVITFQNLFRMYDKLAGMTGTAKTEEDEFRKIYGLDVVAVPTHREMIRRDQEDIVYKSMDAKMRGIAREILRLYTKQQPVLVGTRSIEMSEQTSARLTPEMLQKLVLTDILLNNILEKKVKGEAKKEADALFENSLEAVDMRQIQNVNQMAGLPTNALGDDTADWFLSIHELPRENRHYLDEALRHGIPHNVLNAKYHEKEAAIISEAGRKGAVTIATNMAGRGVDILLGGRVADDQVKLARAQEEEDGGVASEFADTFMSFRRGGKERAAPPLPLDDTERRAAAEEVRDLGGLYILGTERHESRRIDNQLRGRAGRQGDPGESRFFVSLEDVLWKVFNAKMLENPVLKAWPPMEEVRAKFISGMIQKTQERIENHFFEARKHVLEYDDVLNAQREAVYGLRREILLGKDCDPEIRSAVREVIAGIVQSGHTFDPETGAPIYDHAGAYEELNEAFPLIDRMTLSEFESIPPGPELIEAVVEAAEAAFEAKKAEFGPDVLGEIERHVMLRAINDRWMDHLQMIDYIREGIGLRGYGQVDPLVAYKRETFDLFKNTQRGIREQAVKMIYHAQVQREPVQEEAAPAMMRVEEGASSASESGGAVATLAPVDLGSIDWTRVGRNDPCPCGSGKKFKSCHYPDLRAKGMI